RLRRCAYRRNSYGRRLFESERLEGSGEALDTRHMHWPPRHRVTEYLGRQLSHYLVEGQEEAAFLDMALHVCGSGGECFDGKLPHHDLPRCVHRALAELGHDQRQRNEEAAWLTEPRTDPLQGKAKLVGGKLGHHAIKGNPDHRFRSCFALHFGGGLDARPAPAPP